MDRYLGGCWVILGVAGMAWAQGPEVSPVTVRVNPSQLQMAVPQVPEPRTVVVPGQNLTMVPPVYTQVPANGRALRQAHPFVIPPGSPSVPLTAVPYRYEAPRSTWIPREYDGQRFYLIPLKEEPNTLMAESGQTR